ncbi:hypothetical protein Cgig2_002061 [Carnegiea gigantea]|uniref:Aminotransferase-like plant mobile domain-containing protein n=1 Tax=Carnegiea gigantea TaxID=171969 RepID=A0A9Q1GW87_9CARY|nr:hypothetical protein Cgig2_002061 [Carnegiea gigantea]
MDGTLGNEKAPLENRRECGYGPYCRRSNSLRNLNAIPSSTLTSILVRKVRVKQGTLRYHRNDKNKCIDVSKDYENYFNATVLEKVSYYKKELGADILISRPLNFYDVEPLKQAGIFGATGVSQFSYHFDANTWGAFCELWGSLTNTLYHGAGEVGISLYDLERLDHFYREYLVYLAYEEQTDSEKEKVETKKRSSIRISHQKQMTDLNIIAEGEIAAFLAFWLSRFILPHDKEIIRPEEFVMAALMASGQRVSLAPTVLDYIYHGIEDAISNPDYPGKANTIFHIHYVIGWLAELFPCLYRHRPDSDCPDDFPTLVCYVGLLGNKLSLLHARHIFRDGRYLSFRASSYHEDSRNGRDVIDMGLPEEDSKFLLSIRSAVLLVLLKAEGKLKSSLDLKKKEAEQVKADLAEAGFSKL